MFDRKNLKGVLVVMLAALFVAAFVYQASAFEGAGSTPFTYTGKIVSLDKAANIVTVQAGPNSELTVRLNKGASVMKCNMSGSFTDLRTGDTVTVSYFDQGGGINIANDVTIEPSDMNHC